MHLPIQVILLTHSTTLGSTIRTIVATEPPLIRVCAAMTVDHAHTIFQGRVPDVVLLDGQLPRPSVGTAWPPSIPAGGRPAVLCYCRVQRHPACPPTWFRS